MIKLKLGSKVSVPVDNSNQSQNQSTLQNNATSPATPSAPTPGSGPKLKLNFSQPPTPVEQPAQSGFPAASQQPEVKKKRSYQRKQDGPGKGKKRAAEDEIVFPAAKRISSGPGSQQARKLSIKIGGPQPPASDGIKTKISLSNKPKKKSIPKLIDIRARGKAPPRPKGVGYDSEDSDVEQDPAIQQAFLLRMEEGEDANYLREAIASGKIGPYPLQGDAEVSIKFLEKSLRRAVIKIRGRMYGAVLVDLPCIVESMKSFDKKGWWKVADIAQMLLVLGQCSSEEEAKTMQLPKEVNKENHQYAHGLTPPMHWVRRRRFRKRAKYDDKVSVDEEVARLLQADKEWEDRTGGTVDIDHHTRAEQEQSMEMQEEYSADEDDEEGAIETVEMEGQDYGEADDIDAEAMEREIAAELAAQQFQEEDAPAVSDLIPESAAPIAEQAGTMAAVENAMEESEATPVGTPAEATQDEEESDEDESDEDADDDELDVVDEDAAAKAAERAQQMEEVADLEREVERARQKVQAMTNQLLRQREAQKLAALEEDLRVKRSMFGLDPED
ncbi:Transcription initiation factor TFIID subunit 7 [Lecanosticta acicola]|uniref:Transcription initiation factor TFIID subunit 7 n=1 Tax=Lecanosticta acicola TaxID=111012 RepID=A0AAI9EA41_9PEZI|nr:Transcription initiation factor TFIID subunit 7 [Lecanosticta acicola]